MHGTVKELDLETAGGWRSIEGDEVDLATEEETQEGQNTVYPQSQHYRTHRIPI